MLNEFRIGAGNFVAKLLLALLVLSFAIWGVGDMIARPAQNQAVAKIGKQEISLDTFERMYRRELDTIHRSLGDNYTPDLLKSLNVPDVIIKRLVNRTLFKLESEALGLVPSDADIVRRIRSNPSFQDSKGNFDKSIFQGALRNSGVTEQAYVEQMREDMAMSLIVETFTSTTPVSDFAALTLFEAEEEQRIATLYTLTPSLVSNIPEPTKEQITAYYNEHGQEFSAPEYRTLSYISIKAEDIRNKATVSEDDLRAIYKERMEEFRRAERRTIEQLLYSNEDKAKNAYKMLKDGTSFAQVAKTTDPVNKKSLSLGTVEREAILDSAADAVFALKTGGITEPVKSAFGWHIFHVTAINPPSVASFEEVRPMLEKDAALSASENALTHFTNKLEDELAGGSTLTEVAKGLDLKVHTLPAVTREGIMADGHLAKDIPEFDKFLETAFKTDEKSESSLMPTKKGMYYVVRVNSVTPERTKALDEVRPSVISSWQKAEREKRLLTFATDIAQKLSDEKTRAKAIEEYRLQGVSSGAVKRNSRNAGDQPLPSPLVADIFANAPGHSTNAYPLKNGNYIVAVVKDIIPTSRDAARVHGKTAEIRKNLENTVQNELVQQYLFYLANKYPVSVNRPLLETATK